MDVRFVLKCFSSDILLYLVVVYLIYALFRKTSCKISAKRCIKRKLLSSKKRSEVADDVDIDYSRLMHD